MCTKQACYSRSGPAEKRRLWGLTRQLGGASPCDPPTEATCPLGPGTAAGPSPEQRPAPSCPFWGRWPLDPCSLHRVSSGPCSVDIQANPGWDATPPVPPISCTCLPPEVQRRGRHDGPMGPQPGGRPWWVQAPRSASGPLAGALSPLHLVGVGRVRGGPLGPGVPTVSAGPAPGQQTLTGAHASVTGKRQEV